MLDFIAWNDKPTKGCLTKELLGGKGFGLFEMQNLGVPVPEFIIIPTTMCVEYMANPADTLKDVKLIAQQVVDRFIKELGFLPLLSVRSGARVSMPGMMDTILNVGMFDSETETYTKKLTTRSQLDCARRFLQMYGSTVLGIDNSVFEQVMVDAREAAGVDIDAKLDEEDLAGVIEHMELIYGTGDHDLPTSAVTQIEACILAVMNSWNSERAVAYRDHNGIPHDWGTAVVIQRMVFGNMNDDSSSGVCFSRDPADGYDEITGEFLPNAQGEDVVAGIRTPLPLSELPDKVMHELCNVSLQLEQHFRDMLDMEFTVEDKKLYMLQVRTAKRSARAAVSCALAMCNEGLITKEEVFQRISREQVKFLTRPVIDPAFMTKPHLIGIPGCAGVTTGKAAFTVEQAVAYRDAGEDCILIRHETTPDDIKGMFAAVGILTATGGTTSHAAVVARGMDKVCVTGCEKLAVTNGGGTVDFPNGPTINVGDKVTLDGTTGRVWVGIDVPVSDPTDDPLIAKLVEFVNGGGCMADVALPDSPGTVYYMTQFLGDVPAPISKEIVVIEDMEQDDRLLNLTGNDIGVVVGTRFMAWVEQHGVTAKVYSSHSEAGKTGPVEFIKIGKGLDNLLERPVMQSEIEDLFKGSLTSVRKLLAPVKLEDKFQIIGCQRHRLLSAFQ